MALPRLTELLPMDVIQRIKVVLDLGWVAETVQGQVLTGNGWGQSLQRHYKSAQQTVYYPYG